jgi:glutaredoxin
MSNNIIVFTLENCKYCVNLKKILNKYKINFSEIEVNQNRDIWNKVVSQTGHNSLPTVYISEENSEEGIVFVPDIDFKSTKELVEKIKKYI